MKKLKIVCYK